MLKVLTIRYAAHGDGRISAEVVGLPGVSVPLRKDKEEAERDVKAFALRRLAEDMKQGSLDAATMVFMFEEERPKTEVVG